MSNTSTIRELEQQLERVKLAEKQGNDARELADAKERLEGRAYVFNQRYPTWVTVTVRLFGRVSRDSFRGKLEVANKTLAITLLNKPAGAFTMGRGTEISPTSFSGVDQLLRYSTGEIPKSAFNKLWRDSAQLGQGFMSWLAGATKSQDTQCVDTDDLLHGDDESAPPPDLPHVQLEAFDHTLMPRRFQLPGYRYVLTSGSLKAAHKALSDAEQDLRAGSHLYEACDMGYVNDRHAQIARLRSALK